MHADPWLMAAAVGYAAACAFGSAMAVRHDLEGEPLRIRAPVSVPAGVALGWGSGVSAPWPMPAAALAAAGTGWPSRRAAGRICVGLGVLCVAGTLVEPVTWGRRAGGPGARVAIAFNVVAAAALVAAGRRTVVDAGR